MTRLSFSTDTPRGARSLIYKKLTFLAIPIVVQQFVNMTLNIVDSIMVSHLGVTAIAATSVANRLLFLYFIISFGAIGGIGIFINQFFGKKDLETVRRLFALSVIVSVFIGMIFTVLSFFFSKELISVFSSDAGVLELSSIYMVNLAFSYIFLSVTLAMSVSLRSVGFPHIPLIVAVIATVINIIANYSLIYGHFGLPQLGVQGAAIGTLVSRFLETAILVTLFLLNDYSLKTNVKKYFGLTKSMLKNIAAKSGMSSMVEILWSIAATIIAIILSRIGLNEIAILQLSDTIMNLASIAFVGMFVGSSIIIGRAVGAAKLSRVFYVSKEIIGISSIIALIVATILFFCVNIIINAYSLPEHLHNLAKYTLWVTCFSLTLKIVYWVMLFGILRPAGDIRAVFLISTLPTYLITIPAALISVFVLHFGLLPTMIIVLIDDLIKIVLSFHRYLSKKWIKSLT